MPPPSDTDAQFRFLIACIRHSTGGRVDFRAVAADCGIVSKGAAAKRYERLMKSHGPAAAAAAALANVTSTYGNTVNNNPTSDKALLSGRPGGTTALSSDRASSNTLVTTAIRRPPASNKKRKLAACGDDLDEHEVKVEIKSEVKQEQQIEVKEEPSTVQTVKGPPEYISEAGQQWLAVPHLHEHHQHQHHLMPMPHPLSLQPHHHHHHHPSMAAGFFYQDGIWLETQAMLEAPNIPFPIQETATTTASSSPCPDSLAGVHWQNQSVSPPSSEASTVAQGHWGHMNSVQGHSSWCTGHGLQQTQSQPQSPQPVKQESQEPV